MSEQKTYKAVHRKDELSVEINFRSFLAGEGQEFFEPVPVEDLASLASVGTPLTIPSGAPYSADELRIVAEAVRQGGNTLTLKGAAAYPSDVLALLESLAPGLIRHA